jgi:crotonobetainyl-CoA:carnitine CoA-transferase CaiB-like acyl-CoA transferase
MNAPIFIAGSETMSSKDSDEMTHPLPLKGIRIIDATHALAGPFGMMILGDLGADIIKVEPPGGCPTRQTAPYEIDGTSVFFLCNNRNKRSIVINLKDKEGLRVFYELVRRSDAVVYNFAAGVADRLKIDHEALKTINPQIVTCNITGYGSHGPEANRPAMDLVVQAGAGTVSITGEPGRPPVKAGVPIADLSTGLYACLGLVAALRARDETNQAQKVEASLFHSQLSLLNPMGPYALYSGEVPVSQGARDESVAPSQAFEAKDGWITLMVASNRHFEGLCTAMERRDLIDDPRFLSRPLRMTNRDLICPIVAEEIKKKTKAEWIKLLVENGVACSAINNVAEALEHPQAVEFKSVRKANFQGHEIPVLSTPLWFNDDLEPPIKDPPNKGEHTFEILQEILGYEPKRISELVQSGALFGVEPSVNSGETKGA